MAATSINFTYGSTSLDLPANEYPGEPWEDIDQMRTVAMGGRVVSRTRTASTFNNPVLHWTQLDDPKKTELDTFIFGIVLGSFYPFTFTDVWADTYTVRYMGGLEAAKMVQDYLWELTLKLAVIG
jgi:hypothetical protein